ncbi:MAG: hypothetical protein KDI13_11275 [Alphaproteobacteria bacterium]|nr:hypothetical protein [Alphaproteobacteria bacterium]
MKYSCSFPSHEEAQRVADQVAVVAKDPAYKDYFLKIGVEKETLSLSLMRVLPEGGLARVTELEGDYYVPEIFNRAWNDVCVADIRQVPADVSGTVSVNDAFEPTFG